MILGTLVGIFAIFMPSLVSNNGYFFKKTFKFALISCLGAGPQLFNTVLPFYYSTHIIRLLRFHRPIYPSRYNMTDDTLHLFKYSKDLSMLDYVGLQYSCRDRSHDTGIGILRSVIIFSS